MAQLNGLTQLTLKFAAVGFAHGLRKIFFHAGTAGRIKGPDAGGVLFEFGGTPALGLVAQVLLVCGNSVATAGSTGENRRELSDRATKPKAYGPRRRRRILVGGRDMSMGLDVYVGSLTRYYSRDWETVVQQAARQGGFPVHVVRAQDEADAVTDPDAIRGAVVGWRQQLSEALAESLTQPLDWREDADAPYFTDKPAWDCYSGLLLWAAHEEHPELERPELCVDDWTSDEAFRQSSAAGSDTRYPNLLKGAEWWLPADLPFVFSAEDPTGTTAVFGSSIALTAELAELNSRTWRADEDILPRGAAKGLSTSLR